MTASFAELPLDIFVVLSTHLYNDNFSTFISLRSACSNFKRNSDRLFFRTVTFRGRLEVENEILKVLKVPDGAFAGMVHCIRFAPSTQEPGVPEILIKTLNECWKYFVNMRKIIWESPFHVPGPLLSMLADHPSIHVDYVNHEWSRRDHRMDEALLSSVNLHYVDISVLSHSERFDTESEMSLLRTCLLRATNLKHLRLRVSLDTSGVNPHYKYGQLNLPFEKGDHIPPLEELSLDPVNQYYWPTMEHCEVWAQCMNWDAMRILDFGYGCPRYFLKALTGSVPQLKSLTFGTSTRSDFWNQLWTGFKDLNLVSQFLKSIQALEAVKLYTDKDKELREIRSTLLKEHGQSLKHFAVEMTSREGWAAESFLEVRATAPNLEKLVVPLRMQKVDGLRGTETVWPDVSPGRSKLAPRFSMLFSKSSSLQSPKTSNMSWLKAPFTKKKEITLLSVAPARHGHKTSTPPFSEKNPKSTHGALTSFPCLRDLHLKVFLEHDSCQLIEDEREIGTWGHTKLKQQVVTNLVLRLWNESSQPEFMEVAFHAPDPCSKIWTFTAQFNWQNGEKRLAIELKEKGQNYNAASFDPFG